MTTTFTTVKATHNHTRFTVIRQRDGKAPDTLNVSYGAKTGVMTIKANGEKVKGSLAKSALWQAVHGCVADYLTANGVAIGSPTVKAPKAPKEQPAYKSIPYRQLQAELRAYRDNCRVDSEQVSVPLNSKAEVLYDEYMRLGLAKPAGTVHYLNVKPMLGGKENCNGTAPTYKGYTEDEREAA
ncbi:hypothetical protein LPP1_g02 [Leptolyngbya phage LPP-1]|uniref:Uncharacterized protein n=1 Tax=Leptolyngbya phage LPP-1 TaxID=2996049 RepID=A0AAE9PRE6_9CAUD|nr:hypothetical protein LPP1_g02 [Leptolyngbya phage LPP-1]